jgi:hypothetical protein
MQSRAKGILSWCGSGLWWLGGQLYGERLFGVIKPMIPDAIINPTIATIVTWGPPLALVLLGLYFFFRASPAPQRGQGLGDISINAGDSNRFGNIGHSIGGANAEREREAEDR